MSYKKCFSFLLFLFAVLLFDARVARACSCGSRPTVLRAYEGADLVVIVKVLGIERSGKRSGSGGVSSTKVIVEKVFKGNLKVGDEMNLAQGGGADCVWTFNEENIDKQYLFYLGAPIKNSRMWIPWGCGRSSGVDFANDDLLYLNNLDKVRDKTRISGTIVFEKDTDLSVEGRKIRITGTHKTYEVKTDRNGVYEIYDLPAGKYLIEPELPRGWKVDNFWLQHAASYAGNKEDKAPRSIPITLESRKHAGLDIHFEVDNAIRGRVYDPGGKPMKGVCVTAVKTQSEQSRGFEFDCTEEDGTFAITEVTPGSYLLVINDDGKISSSEPFETFYYPNVAQREKATVITIGAGETLESLDIYVPKVEETIKIEGVFLYSDGKPVIDEAVQFKAEKTKDNLEGNARAKTDAHGRFSIKILKGLKGKLYGEMYTYTGEFENCPKLERVIKKTGRDNAEIATPSIEIQADSDLYDLELKFPFPGCKKAKLLQD